MRVGVPKEIKNHEYRVGLTPGSVREVVHRGHEVVVETNAAQVIGLEDAHYRQAGATIVETASEVWSTADMVVKVKEPQPSEYPLIREDQVLFTYLHLAPDPGQTQALIDSKSVAIAYETVTDPRGGLPLLTPMSAVAGRMSVQVGAHCLEIEMGGRGQLLGGVPGVPAAKVVILGGGIVGTHATSMAVGLGASVWVIDMNPQRLYELDLQFGSKIHTVFSTMDAIEEHVLEADLVIGAVLVAGAEAPKLVSAEMVKKMRRGAVMVDVSIDQGGCFETSRPTSHAEPTYIVDDVVHYCVTNMPGAMARTSTFALNNATLPFVLDLADKGWRQALQDNPHLANGLNVHGGIVTNGPVARALSLPYRAVSEVLAA
jgi:alanine dehydrogenase